MASMWYLIDNKKVSSKTAQDRTTMMRPSLLPLLSLFAVRAIAAQYKAGGQQSWAFKLKDDNGADIRTALASAEAAGLLRAVDSYRAAMPAQLAAPSGHHTSSVMTLND
jgi:hypothetical protein